MTRTHHPRANVPRRGRGRGRGRGRRWGLLAALVGPVTGCYDGFDPLDPAVLNEVMRTRGDAEGSDRSGIYLGVLETLECGCPPIDQRLDLEYSATLCGLLEYADDLELEEIIAVELIQGDGSVRLRAVGTDQAPNDATLLLPTLYGPLYRDGRITAAGALEVDALYIQGAARARIDGTLTEEPGMLEIEYQQHNSIDLLGNALDDVLDGFNRGDDEVLQTLDCRERIRLSMQWFGRAAPPASIPED